MYIDTVPNRKFPPAILLRRAWREGKEVKKRTVANLSKWPAHKVEALRRLLRGETLVSVKDAFATERTLPHGHVEAVLGTIKKLGLDRLIASKRCREGDLVSAMVAEQLIHPCSKLATTRVWHTTTLSEELGVEDADEDELYGAMDWVVRRQGRIEEKLAGRHLSDGGLVLYDVTSSYYEGKACSLVMRKALAPLLFDDEESEENRKTRDPVAPAKPSESAKRKRTTHLTCDGLPVHSFDTLLKDLATRCRNTCRVKSDPTGPRFQTVTEPTPLQVRALQLLGLYPVNANRSPS